MPVGVIACDDVAVLGVRSDRSAGRCDCLLLRHSAGGQVRQKRW